MNLLTITRTYQTPVEGNPLEKTVLSLPVICFWVFHKLEEYSQGPGDGTAEEIKSMLKSTAYFSPQKITMESTTVEAENWR